VFCALCTSADLPFFHLSNRKTPRLSDGGIQFSKFGHSGLFKVILEQKNRLPQAVQSQTKTIGLQFPLNFGIFLNIHTDS